LNIKTIIKNKAIIDVYGSEWKKIPEAKRVPGQGRSSYLNKIFVPTNQENLLVRNVLEGQIIRFDFMAKNGLRNYITIYNESQKDSRIYVQEGENKDFEIPVNYREKVEAFLKTNGFWLSEFVKGLSDSEYSYLDHFINPVNGDVETIFELVKIEDYREFDSFPDLIGKIKEIGLGICGRDFGSKNVFAGEVGKNKVLFDSFMVTLDEDGNVTELNWAGEGLIQKAQKASAFSMFNEIVYSESSLEKSSVYLTDKTGEKIKEIKAKDIITFDMTICEIKERDLFLERIIKSQKEAVNLAKRVGKNNKDLGPEFRAAVEQFLAVDRKWLLRNGVLYSVLATETKEIGKLVDLVTKTKIDLRVMDVIYGYTKMF
jgi:hypothetical protein